MANYSLFINSQFKPLTYEEIVRPLQEQTAEQNAYEDAYSAIQAQAESLKQRAEKEPNSEWAKKYNDYMQSLNDAADKLIAQGLAPTSRMAVNNAKNNYSKYVVPVQDAIKQQYNLAEIAAKQSPALRMEYQSMPSIDELIANPTTQRLGYSGSDIEASAQKDATAASAREVVNAFMKDPKNAGYMLQIKRMGFNNNTFRQMLAAAQNSNDPNLNILSQIFNQVRNQFGYMNDDRLSDTQKMKLDNEVISGLYKGIAYQEDAQHSVDQYNLEAVKNQYDMQKLAAQHLYNMEELQYKYPEDEDGNPISRTRSGSGSSSGSSSNNKNDAPQYKNMFNVSDDFDTYTALKKRILRGNGGMNWGLFAKVRNNEGKMKSISPMMIYEDLYDYRQKATASAKNIDVKNNPKASTPEIDAYEKRKQYWQSKGVTSFLTDNEYQQLSRLGFSNKSTRADYYNIEKYLDRLANTYVANSINLKDNTGVSQQIAMSLREGERNNVRTLAYDVKNGKRGEPITNLAKLGLVKITDENGNADGANSLATENGQLIKSIYYTVLEPNHILVTNSDGKDIYLAPEALGQFSGRVKQIINLYSPYLKMSRAEFKKATEKDGIFDKTDFANYTYDELRHELAEKATMHIRNILTDVNKN